MSIIVPRCGFNRNTKKAILYGPLALGGANFRSLASQQGISQVMMFIRQWRKNSLAGKLLRIAVSWFQSQVGVSFSILESVCNPLPHLESKWLRSLRMFLASINAKLRLDTPYLPELQRLHDVCIMDAILSSGKFNSTEICKLNYCRLYLNVVTISDLTLINGRQLDHNKLLGNHSCLSSFTHGTTIHQERPSERTWTLWKKGNQIWSTPEGTLYQPLGDWVLPIHQLRQRHAAYWWTGRLWVRIQDRYTKCTMVSDRHFCETATSCSWEALPRLAVPMFAILSAPGCWKIVHQSHILELNRPPIAGTFSQYIASLSNWESELLTHLDMSDNPFSVAVALEHGVRAVSDGSDWHQIQGAFGWTISTDRGDRCARGMGPASSPSPHAYRSESYGLLSLLCFLRRLAEFTGKHDQWFGIVATDSQSLIDTILQRRAQRLPGHDDFNVVDTPVCGFPLEPTLPEWDVIRGIQVLLQEMPLLTLRHVKGHQDRGATPYQQLPLLAQLNVEADTQASRYQRELGTFRPVVLLTEWAGVHLEFPTGTVTAHYETALRYQATAPALKTHMQERYSWSQHTIAAINWQAHGKAMRRSLDHRTFLVKLVHGILPTNQRLHRSDHRRNKCPSCQTVGESWQHILCCLSVAHASWRTSMMTQLDSKCTTLGTMPRLHDLLLQALRDWCMHDPHEATVYQVQPSPNDSPLIRRVIFQQNAIGWDHIFLGRFSSEWASVQDAYYARKAQSTETKRQTGQTWQTAIISCIWQQLFLLWTIRNQALHGADSRLQAQAARREVERQLTDLYDLRNHMEPSVQRLLHQDLTEHLSKTVAYNKKWLSIYGPLVKQSIKRAKAKAIQGVKAITHYFGTTR
jgi:hypothetical protein